MSDSIKDKLRLIGLGNVHTILNKVIDLNDLGAVEQQVRDLAEASEGLHDQASRARHRAKEAEKKVAAKVKEQEQRRTRILGIMSDGDDSNNSLALPLQMAYNTDKEALPGLEQERDEAATRAKELTEAAALVEGQLEALRLRVSNLRDRRETSESEDDVSDALGAGIKATDGGLGETMSRLEREAAEDLAASRARFDRSLGKLQATGQSDEAVAAAQADLAALKAELAGTPTGAGSQA